MPLVSRTCHGNGTCLELGSQVRKKSLDLVYLGRVSLDRFRQTVRPCRLPRRQVAKKGAPAVCETYQLRAPVNWIVDVFDETIFGEKVGRPLDALSRKPHHARYP